MAAEAFSNLMVADLMGGWELVLILAVVLILVGAKRLSDLADGFNQGIGEFKEATRYVADEVANNEQRERGVVYETITPDSRTANFTFRTPFEKDSSLILFIAQGFGVGQIPFAPGTFGSLVGILWFALLLSTGKLWLYLTCAFLGVCFSVWACGKAERILKQKNPPSVVLDEIVAIPFCFFPWVINECFQKYALPAPETFFNARNWLLTALIFALFRIFDIAKPWPVRRSQSLPGGWGVTMDDLIAAVYVNLVILLIYGGRILFVR